LMEGLVDMAEQILDLPARSGAPDFVGGLSGEVASPVNAAVVGILLYGFHKKINLKKIHSLKDGTPKQPGLLSRLFG
ncbi:MAG TPA: hypothetical protein VLZ81_09135, partial [Blastocatellia bacterium]|nr:hypothetical protein [Blastocatellia bacterium]